MRACPKCHRTYPDDTDFCPRDGAQLTSQVTETEAQLAASLARHFRVVKRLGAGGMGTVFMAEQLGVGNRPVALKVLNRKLLDDPDFLLRFQNEAGSTGRIHHPNVVTIYESAQAEDGTPYIAMEFLEGETLRAALQRRGALPVQDAAEILLQAARGLNAAHKLGIIHRDLKPDNLFLAQGDEGEVIVKVMDFGIAKLRESATHTQTGMVLGTPAYMSCEQASGMRSDELDARSDIYSMGVVMYEMLSGRVPFHSDTPLGYLRKHMLEQPPPLHAVCPSLDVEPAVESAVMKALAKERDQRYGSMLDFARAVSGAVTPTQPLHPSEPLLSTKVASPPAAAVSTPVPSAKIASPAPVPESAASVLRPSASTPAHAEVAVQTPPPTPSARIAEPTPSQPFPTPAPPVRPETADSEPAPAAAPPRFGDKAVKLTRALVRSVRPRTSLLTGGLLILLTLFLPIAYQSCGPSQTGLVFLQGGPGSLPIFMPADTWGTRGMYVFTLVFAALSILLVLLSLAAPGVLQGRRWLKFLFGMAGEMSLFLLSAAVTTACFVGWILLGKSGAPLMVAIPGLGVVMLGLALRSRILRGSKLVMLLMVLGCVDCVILLADHVVSLSTTAEFLPKGVPAWMEISLAFLYWFIPAYLWFRYRLIGNPARQGQWPALRGGIVKLYLPCVLAVPGILWLSASMKVWGFIPYTAGVHLITLGYMQLVQDTQDSPSRPG
jgi:serine/threonine protein kinase